LSQGEIEQCVEFLDRQARVGDVNGGPSQCLSGLQILIEIVQVHDLVMLDPQHLGCRLVDGWFRFTGTDGERLDHGIEPVERQILGHGGAKLGERVGEQGCGHTMASQGHHPLHHDLEAGVSARCQQRIDLVTVQPDSRRLRVWSEQSLDIGDGDLAALAPVPRVVAAVTGAQQHLEQHGGGDPVTLSYLTDLIGDRGDEHTTEIEHHGAVATVGRSRWRRGHATYPTHSPAGAFQAPPSARGEGPMTMNESWATLWEAIAAAQPDHTAVVVGATKIKWRELDERASRLAAALHAHGVGHDAKVAQLMYNCPEYLESAYASFKVRASTVNVNYRYKAPEIVHVVDDSDAEVLVFHGAFSQVVTEALPSLPKLRVLIQVDGGDGVALLPGAVDYEALMAAHEPMAPIERSGDDALLLYTGGTTGLPKGVVWRHNSLFGALAFTGYGSMGIEPPTTPAEVGRIAAELNAKGVSPVNMTAPPLMHGTALFLAFGTFVLGGTVVLLGERRFDPVELLTLVQNEKVSQLSIVGDAFARPIVAELERAEAAGTPYDISSLARVLSTGATLSSSFKAGLMQRAPKTMVMDMIGASEGGPFALSITPPGGSPADTAVFTATPNTVVLDPDTWERIEAGSGRSGMLGVSGPMPDGYYKDPEKSARTFPVIDGVRYTVPGDYAVVDADGTVHLLGRGSVCINTGGEKVYPEEVEVAARSHDGVEDCVAVGVPDERFGQAVTLVASRRVGATVTADEIIAHVKARIADYKAPKSVVFVDSVYRSPSGKADYRWAQQVAVGG